MVSHYKFLDWYLNDFWLKIFGKDLSQTGFAGIIGAHGDKVYQYRESWEKAGQDFYVSCMIYMLTYTSELGDTPKQESRQWVIDNYHHYLQYLPDINYVTPEEFKNIVKIIETDVEKMFVNLSTVMTHLISDKGVNSTINGTSLSKMKDPVTRISALEIEKMLSERGYFVLNI